MDVCINAQPNLILHVAPPPLFNCCDPPAIVYKPVIAQPNLDSLCKILHAAVCILNAVEDTSPPLPSPLKTTRSINALVKNKNFSVAATSTVQYIGVSALLAASAASAALAAFTASRASYCYEV